MVQMVRLGRPLGPMGAPPFNPDAASLAIYASFTTPPTLARKKLIDKAVKSLKSSGIWTKLDFLHVYAAADSQAALKNWINPGTFDASLGNSGGANPTFTTDRGFTTDGVGNFVDTGFNPVTAAGHFALNSASCGGYQLNNLQQNTASWGWFDGTDGTTFQTWNASNQVSVRINQAAVATVGGVTQANGLTSLDRTGAALSRTLRNGVSLQTPNAASAAMNSVTFKIGNPAAAGFSVVQMAYDFGGQDLGGAAGHLNLYNAMLLYQQPIGAN